MKRAILLDICFVVFFACAFVISATAAATRPASPKLQLVRNGKSTYRIVLSDNASEFDKKAGGELQKYAKQISGAYLPIVVGTGDETDSIVWIASAGHIQKAPFPIERHKLDTYKDNWGLFVHTARTLVPPEKYFKDHPEYFSQVPSGRVPNAQLCLTNPDVFRIVVDGLRERMNEKPNAQFWSVSQNDTYSPCECDSCKKISEVEASPSGSILAFVDRVADEFPDKTISTLAYQYSRSPLRNIKPRKNVNIMLCCIECNRSKPLETDPSSESFRKDVEDWTKLTSNIFLWDYVIQFRNLVSPFPNFRVLQPNIRFFVKHGITSVFEQGLGSMEGEFGELRIYLIAKLLWNPDINVDSVMNDFLSGCYGKAAPYIRKYIDRMHDALDASGEPLLIYGYPLPSENGYLSPKKMDAYVRLFDLAERAVRSDPQLLFRVKTARLPLQFAILEQAKVYGTREHGFYVKGKDGRWKVKPEMKPFCGSLSIAVSWPASPIWKKWTLRRKNISRRPKSFSASACRMRKSCCSQLSSVFPTHVLIPAEKRGSVSVRLRQIIVKTTVGLPNQKKLSTVNCH